MKTFTYKEKKVSERTTKIELSHWEAQTVLLALEYLRKSPEYRSDQVVETAGDIEFRLKCPQ
jgi:hypothetical protein